MGQYYRPVVLDDEGITVYNRKLDGEYTLAKLMEHSWYLNDFVNSLVSRLYEQPSRVIWCGDYAHQEELDVLDNRLKMEKIWPDVDEPDEAVGISTEDFDLVGKYLVNHSEKTYVDCDKYFKESRKLSKIGWVPHPVPLLTAVGNGRGGGDYSGTDMDAIGAWAWSLISIEDEIPAGYEVVDVVFAE